jgi:ankyrin repeat protein
MSYLFYGINSAVKYARDGYSKELSDFLSKKPHLINQKNKNGNSILHIACWKGNCDMVLMLLMRGADVNILDSKGYTPLLVAIEFGHDKLATSLLERGANINIGNEVLCLPLHVAALSGCKNMVIPLLEWGADIDATETVRDGVEFLYAPNLLFILCFSSMIAFMFSS